MGMISNENLNEFLKEVREKAKGEDKLLEQFERCFLNTLETTVKMKEDGTVYVITGDIPAMWLRDSTAQIRPFLFPAKENEEIRQMIAGLVKRQFYCICLDPYANAFNEGPTGACWEKDDPDQSPWVWERKFEVDSLCYPIQLAWMLWKNTGCTDQFDGNFRTGARKILNVFRTEQNHEYHSAYRFVREGSFYTDTLSRDGRGAFVRPDIGMVYAYEADGYGIFNLMDDANVPSLLSISYLGYPADRETMEHTRKMILSEANPYYYKGTEAAGIGSPHTPAGYIWPIALAMQGLTEGSREKKRQILDTLVSCTGGTGMMHEGFCADDPGKYTREWFSWANAMYAELFLDYLGYRLEI